MKKILVLALTAVMLLPLSLKAQGYYSNEEEEEKTFAAYVEADLLSHYMWRGQDRGGISIQPEVGLKLGDFSFRARGNVGFDKDDEQEVNLTLGYEKFGFNIGVTDYWQTGLDEEDRYFHFKKYETAHSVEANIGYTHEYFSLQAYTKFWGNDYRIDGKQAYSTFIELSVPFHIGDIDIEGRVGITPMESAGKKVDKGKKDDLGNTYMEPEYFYGEGFTCNMVSLRATKTFYYRSLQFPIFAEIHTNPYLRKANFLLGVCIIAF